MVDNCKQVVDKVGKSMHPAVRQASQTEKQIHANRFRAPKMVAFPLKIDSWGAPSGPPQKCGAWPGPCYYASSYEVVNTAGDEVVVAGDTRKWDAIGRIGQILSYGGSQYIGVPLKLVG